MSDDDAENPDSGKPTILAEDPERDTGPAVELMIAREQAIQAYANLEQSLASIFATLLKTDYETAGIVFFRIINSRSRNIILEDLFKKRYKTKFSSYRNSIISMIKNTDNERNQIIHWHVIKEINIGADFSSTAHFRLQPPNFWKTGPDKPSMHSLELQDFRHRCDFLSRSINRFQLFMLNKLDGPALQTWLEIFQQPAVFPPPDTHPLSPNYKGPDTPPRSSPK